MAAAAPAGRKMRLGMTPARAAVLKGMVPPLDFGELGPCAGGAGYSSGEEEEDEDEDLEEFLSKEVADGDENEEASPDEATDLCHLWKLWETELALAHSAEKRKASEVELMKLLMARHVSEIPREMIIQEQASLKQATPQAVSKSTKTKEYSKEVMPTCDHCGGTCDGPCEFAKIANPFAAGGAVTTDASTSDASSTSSASGAPRPEAAMKKRQAAPSVAELLMQQLDTLASESSSLQPAAAQDARGPSSPALPNHEPSHQPAASPPPKAKDQTSLRDPRPGAALARLAAAEDEPTSADDAKPPLPADGPSLAELRAEGEARRQAKQLEREAKRSASPALNKGHRKAIGASPSPAPIAAY
jgi:hypothetical protein